MKTPEYYFREGALQMQSRITAYLVSKGHMDVSIEIYSLPLPKYKEPEVDKIIKGNKNEN